MPDLARRNRQPEIMDQPGLDPGEHAGALRGLERINRFSSSDRILWSALERLALEHPGRPLRVLDIAAGGGDVAVRLWHRAHRAGLPIEFTGADISPTAVAFAQERAKKAGVPIEFLVLDVIGQELPRGYDVVMCSLFLHHLYDEQAERLLSAMSRVARQMVLVNDLLRSRSGYWLAWAGTRILSRSSIVHTDGPRSVEAAFTIDEVRSMAERAGLAGAQISRRWPCRFLLEWRRPE